MLKNICSTFFGVFYLRNYASELLCTHLLFTVPKGDFFLFPFFGCTKNTEGLESFLMTVVSGVEKVAEVGALGLRTVRKAQVTGNLPHASS